MPRYSKGAEYKAEQEPPFLPCQVESTQSIRFRFSHMQHKYLRPEANSRSTTGLPAATSPEYSVPLAAAVTYIHFFRVSQAFLESTQWRIQDFLRGGANSQKCYYFSIFCQKLHENERIWTPRGGARPWRPPPLDPPMVQNFMQIVFTYLPNCLGPSDEIIFALRIVLLFL